MKIQIIFFTKRKEHKLTLRDVAAKTGKSYQAISDTENIKKRVISTRTDLYKQLCSIYGLEENVVYDMILSQKAKELNTKK